MQEEVIVLVPTVVEQEVESVLIWKGSILNPLT